MDEIKVFMTVVKTKKNNTGVALLCKKWDKLVKVIGKDVQTPTTVHKCVQELLQMRGK